MDVPSKYSKYTVIAGILEWHYNKYYLDTLGIVITREHWILFLCKYISDKEIPTCTLWVRNHGIIAISLYNIDINHWINILHLVVILFMLYHAGKERWFRFMYTVITIVGNHIKYPNDRFSIESDFVIYLGSSHNTLVTRWAADQKVVLEPECRACLSKHLSH